MQASKPEEVKQEYDGEIENDQIVEVQDAVELPTSIPSVEQVNHKLKYRSCTEILDSPIKVKEHTKQECEKCDDACETTEARKSHIDDEHFE